jgi:hypothetical protein
VETRYRLVVAGTLPRLTETKIRDRFGDVSIASEATRTVLDGIVLDQAALRALLTLLWNGGGEVLEVEPSPSTGGDV